VILIFKKCQKTLLDGLLHLTHTHSYHVNNTDYRTVKYDDLVLRIMFKENSLLGSKFN